MDLFRNNQALARYITKRWVQYVANSRVPYDDILQAAQVGLWKATENYDRDIGPFGAWAGITIRHEIQDLFIRMGGPVKLRKSGRKYRMGSEGSLSMDKLQEGHHPEVQSDAETDAASILASLTDEQRKVMVLKFEEGLTWAAVAKQMHCTIWKVRQIVEAVILRVAGLPEQ